MTAKGGQMIYRDGLQLHASSITNIDHFDIPNEPPKIVTRANSRLNNVVSHPFTILYLILTTSLRSSLRISTKDKTKTNLTWCKSLGEKTSA